MFLSNYKRRRLGLRLLEMLGEHAVGAVGFVLSLRSLKREAGWKCGHEHESSRFGGAKAAPAVGFAASDEAGLGAAAIQRPLKEF